MPIRLTAIHLGASAVVVLVTYAFYLLNGDGIPDDDALSIARRATEAFRVWPYYGHIPAAWLGIKLYFWLTPLLMYLGLLVLFRKQEWYLPILVWIFLFVGSNSLLKYLSAGSFIPLINFFLLGSIVFRVLAAKKFLLPSILLVGLVLFHTETGTYVLAGATLYYILLKSVKYVIVFTPAWIALAASGLGLNSTARFLPKLTLNPLPYDLGILMQYVGIPVVVLVVTAMVVLFVSRLDGYRVKIDDTIAPYLFLLPLLLAGTLHPLSIDPDRPLKLGVMLLVVLAVTGLVKGIKHTESHRIGLKVLAGAIVTVVILLYVPLMLAEWSYLAR